MLIDALSWLCLTTGCFFALVGAIGLLRLPDFYSRMHGAGITDTMGAGLIWVGLMLQAGFTLITVKLIMILFFLLVTSPTAGHALARSALSQNLEPLTGTPETPEAGSS